MTKTYTVSTSEGRTVTLTPEQTDRYDAGEDVLAEVTAGLAPGDYSIYAADGGPLLQNISVP
ncbi:MAG TPA: hypothetical protein VFX37_15245 [Pseudolabrys sp.]|nr:hypothetical protein [Pseudolabrys sp.]